MYTVEIVEPTRLILKDGETQGYVTIAYHETDEEGLNNIKSFEVGDEVEVTLKHKKAKAKAEPEEKEEEEGVETTEPEPEPEPPKKTFAALNKKKK